MDSIAQARPVVWSAAFGTPDEMAAAQKDARIEYQSLADRANYAGRLSVVDLGEFRFQTAADGAHVVRGTIEAGRNAILMPRAGAAPGLKVNGWGENWDQGGVLLRSGAELLAVTPAPQQWSALVVSDRHFAALADGARMPSAGGFAALPDVMLRAPRLRSFSDALAEIAWNDPERLGVGSVAAAVSDELAFYFDQACVQIAEARHRSLRLGRRLRLVSQAEEYLRSRLGQAIYSRDVAAALGVSERTLGDAFTAAYGMSLQRYLLLRRLNQVQRVLATRREMPTLVKTVALDFGFWNLGRFARAYRDLFGETPSQTAKVAASLRSLVSTR